MARSGARFCGEGGQGEGVKKERMGDGTAHQRRPIYLSQSYCERYWRGNSEPALRKEGPMLSGVVSCCSSMKEIRQSQRGGKKTRDVSAPPSSAGSTLDKREPSRSAPNQSSKALPPLTPTKRYPIPVQS